MDVLIQTNAAAAAELAARIIARDLGAKPETVLGLATGRTMEGVYARLVEMHRFGELDFSACRTFNLDEYVGLPGNDRNSYRHYMNEHLFRRVNIEMQNTHLPDGQAIDLEAECQQYEQIIQREGGIDLQLLGIGLSGHIGFNEPLAAFRSRTRVVALAPMTIQQNAPLFSATTQMPRQAITMGIGTILDSRRCVLLATGKDKAQIIAEAVEGPLTAMLPASALQLHPNCTIIVDEAAAQCFVRSDYYRWLSQNEPRWDWLRQISLSNDDQPGVIPASDGCRLQQV